MTRANNLTLWGIFFIDLESRRTQGATRSAGHPAGQDAGADRWRQCKVSSAHLLIGRLINLPLVD